MQGNEYHHLIDPLTEPTPIYIHLSDINGIDSFFVFMDAAIRCHPFVLITSFTLTLLFFYIVTNSKNIYHKILCSYSNYSRNKNLYNKGGE